MKKQPKSRQPKDEAIMTLIREYDRSSYTEISLMTGYSVHALKLWVYKIRQQGNVHLKDKRTTGMRLKRPNETDWSKVKI